MFSFVVCLFLFIFTVELFQAAPAPKIIGGKRTTTSYPFMASLQVSGTHICGGTLIAPSYILTAAHCAQDNVLPTVLLGAHSTFAPEQDSETLQGAEWIIHPEFNLATLDNDIAILRLEGAASPSRTLAIPVFQTENPSVYTAPGTNSTIIGWGRTMNSQTYNSILNEATVLTVSHEVCAAKNPSLVIEDSMICAGPKEGGVGSCFGDSGGPMLNTENKNIQIGISSWVMGPKCAQPGDYSGYTRLSNYASFVSEATTCCTSTDSASCRACNLKMSVQNYCLRCLSVSNKDSGCQSCDIGAVFSLSPSVQSFNYGVATFGPEMKDSQIVAPLTYVSGLMGCADISVPAVASSILLIDRGVCGFSNKTLHAQEAGALAVIIVNHLDSGAVKLSGAGEDFETTLTIPTISISKQDGAKLKDLLLQGDVTMLLGRIQGEQLPSINTDNDDSSNPLEPRIESVYEFESCESSRIPLHFLTKMSLESLPQPCFE